MQQKGFTLIELLVVIGIITILAVVVILTLNPAQLLAQSRDSNRISDLNTLKSAISLYLADVSSPDIGDASKCYETIASPIPYGTGTNCGAFLAGTASTSADIAVDGTGWVPITFTNISAGSPIAKLPIDPVNTTSFYYAYRASSTLTFEIDGHMESTKYATTSGSNVQSTDGGDSPYLYEVGTAPGLAL